MGFVVVIAVVSLGKKFKGDELRKSRQGNIPHPSAEESAHH